MDKHNIKKRSEIPKAYKWNLEDMFATDEDWEKEYAQTIGIAKDLEAFQGKLGESAKTLLAYLKQADELSYHTARVYIYANERYHQDTKVSKYQGYAEKADQMMVEVQSATAFSCPEILAIPEKTLDIFMDQNPELEKYRRYLSEIFRQKEHTLSPELEALLAKAGELAVAPQNIFGMLNDADIHFGTITDVQDNRIPVTHGNFILLLKNKDRKVRKYAFDAVYHAYEKLANTISATFIAHLKQEHFFAQSRRYKSTRAMHLDHGNIPEAVYDNLLASVHEFLPALKRYMELRKRLLGVDKLHMYDLYIPIVEDSERSYTFDQAKTLVAEAMAPMGEEYVSILKDGMDKGWIDVYENENKRSGAYSWTAYGTHPYVLLNYQDDLDSVFTLAHEMGHAMHSYYSNQNQPVTYSDYQIFVAEVASTCNESLLMHYMLENSHDRQERLYLMNHYLEQFRTTVFRQAMFAEFEHTAHTKLAQGEALTRESLCKMYHEINEEYYGGVVVIDEEIDYEWMRIPHFYNSYYVYQYATGFSAAVAFSRRILEGGQAAVTSYKDHFLSGGCSKDPIELLAAAGVDMNTPEPVYDALKVFEKYLDAFEAEVI